MTRSLLQSGSGEPGSTKVCLWKRVTGDCYGSAELETNLLSRKFTVLTDQKSLKFLLEQSVITRDHQKWIVKLSGYDFDIVYRPGKENGVANALSRRGEEVAC